MKSHFVIVADRANLKAFRVEKAPAERGSHLTEVQTLTFAEGHARLREVNTDASGRRGNSTADQHWDIESDRRATRTLTEAIEKVLGEEKPDTWAFAAPAEIKDGVISHLSGEWRNALQESVGSDLVKVAPNRLPEHFETVQAA